MAHCNRSLVHFWQTGREPCSWITLLPKCQYGHQPNQTWTSPCPLGPLTTKLQFHQLPSFFFFSSLSNSIFSAPSKLLNQHWSWAQDAPVLPWRSHHQLYRHFPKIILSDFVVNWNLVSCSDKNISERGLRWVCFRVPAAFCAVYSINSGPNSYWMPRCLERVYANFSIIVWRKLSNFEGSYCFK